MNKPALTLLETVIDFLNSIGIITHLKSDAKGFVNHIEIHDGELYVDPELAQPSNILHEAGHLAITPACFRKFMGGDLAIGIKKMIAILESNQVEFDSPLFKAVIQCSDTEATAWAWAAGKHLSIPDELIILDSEYNDSGEEIRTMLQFNAYFGIHGLANAGFCNVRGNMSHINGKPAYPTLAYWTQPFSEFNFDLDTL